MTNNEIKIIINTNKNFEPSVGSSDKGWKEAAQVAVDEAKKTLHGIHGIEVKNMTAIVDGKITQYRAGIKVSFGIEH